MFKNITNINKNNITVLIDNSKITENLVNKFVVIGNQTTIIGEVISQNIESVEINLIGEIENNIFKSGVFRSPSFHDNVRTITKEELETLVNMHTSDSLQLYLGNLINYENFPIHLNINQFFSNHFAIFGNTGSGKSSFIARLLQNLFSYDKGIPYNANILLFDVYDEYSTSLSSISKYSDYLSYKAYTTDLKDKETNLLRIPLRFLNVDDLALLLNIENYSQIKILERTLKLVGIINKSSDKETVDTYKNHILANAILEILTSGKKAEQMRDQALSILTKFSTDTFNLDTKVVIPGMTKTYRQCFNIDVSGKISDIQLLTSFTLTYVKEGLKLDMPESSIVYDLHDMYEAMNYALIAEGTLNNERAYQDYNELLIKLSALINSDVSNIFTYDKTISLNEYIKNLIYVNNSKKAQIIHFNINNLTDRYAKTIVKIFSRIVFDFSTSLEDRGAVSFHLFLEEAHRYLMNDNELNILGYNIFDRIAKEGRKYGVLLGIISQRPSELSETALSQCSNYIIFKLMHPKDIGFIAGSIPNLTLEKVEVIKNLRPGTCMLFGNSISLPFLVDIDMPNPANKSNNVNISDIWFINKIGI